MLDRRRWAERIEHHGPNGRRAHRLKTQIVFLAFEIPELVDIL